MRIPLRWPRQPMAAVGMTLGLVDSLIALYFLWASGVQSRTSEFGGFFEFVVAELLGAFAAGALLLASLALVAHRKWPVSSGTASALSVVSGLVPPCLIIAFAGVQHFG